MIQTFACPDTRTLFETGRCHRKWQEIERVAPRKLDMLDAAVELTDLRVPPGNRLEALVADRAGQHSIRINDNWRLCFVWGSRGPDRVEVVDYH